MTLREVFSFMCGVFFGLAIGVVGGCGPAQHPCVTAYEKAGECPECSADEIEARIAAVDESCAHMLLPSASASAGAP